MQPKNKPATDNGPYPVETLKQLWLTEQISTEQVISQLLLHTANLQAQFSQLRQQISQSNESKATS